MMINTKTIIILTITKIAILMTISYSKKYYIYDIKNFYSNKHLKNK